jgi:hypothetical protein
VLRRLAGDGLLFIKDQKVVINGDIEELSALADFEQSDLRPLPISEFADATW